MQPEKLTLDRYIQMPANHLPIFRHSLAEQNGAANHWLFYCWGGIGDRVCSEPTIRWAHKHLPWKRFGIATENPELFEHIDCKKFCIGADEWDRTKWHQVDTITPQEDGWLPFQFFAHLLTNAVDFCSIHALRMQLPVADREITLPDFPLDPQWDFFERGVIVHPGKHWASKTFPADWWASVCRAIAARGLVPVVIGKTVDENIGVVDFELPPQAIDLREQLSLRQLIAILKNARCLVSNDSAPIHMAAAGNAWIGVIATCKHPDYIGHWRHGCWQWRFRNLSKDGLYNHYSVSPFNPEGGSGPYTVSVEGIDPEFLLKCLPDPATVADFAVEAMSSS